MDSKSKTWVDDDDEDVLPPTETFGPDKNGIKTVIEYVLLDGKKTKITRKIQITKSIRKVPVSVVRRQALKSKKFGQASNEPPGPHHSTTSMSLDDIKIEDPNAVEENAADALLKLLTEKSQERSFQKSLAADGLIERSEGLRTLKRSETGVDGKYVLPTMRGSLGAAAAVATVEDRPTLRFSNLSASTTDVDLRELCKDIARPSKVYIAKDRRTGESRGFAYVNFMSKRDAEKVKTALDGSALNHLIIKIEWAKPATRGGGEGGFNRAHVSGYGKALPQGVGLKPTRR